MTAQELDVVDVLSALGETQDGPELMISPLFPK